MTQFKNRVLPAVGVLTLALAFCLTDAGRALAAAGANVLSVLITNTADNPVPTTVLAMPEISGTVGLAAGTSVSVNGPVSLASGTTVGLASGTTVGVSGTVDVGTPTVHLASGTTVAVDAQVFPRFPVQTEASISIASGLGGNQLTSFSPPAGKIFVVEYVSAIAIVPEGQYPTLMFFNNDGNGSSASLFFDWTLQSTVPDGISSEFVLSKQTRFYVHGGGALTYNFGRGGAFTGGALATVSLSGYLIDDGSPSLGQ
jgi:hypothetical protein